MRKLQEAQGLEQLIEAGSTGYLPLFYHEWITESYEDKESLKTLSFSRASETVNKIFQKMERHTSIEKKKTAIQAMQDEERRHFIRSFMKMVEYKTLDRMRELH